MIGDRGYVVPSPVDVGAVLPRMLADAAKCEPRFILLAAMHCTHETAGTTFLVVQTLQCKLGVTTVRFIKDTIEDKYPDCNSVLVVYNDSITPFAKRTLSAMTGRDIQVSPIRRWSYRVTRSGHVPAHRRLTADELVRYFDANPTIAAADLPRIRTDDRVVMYYGWSRGDIICVDRFGRNYNAVRRYRIVW